MVDGTGAVVNRYQYDAFGNTVEAVEKVQNRFRYAGEQYDQVTGQYYLRARFYNPVVGRFTQEDTYRGDGLNLYAYVSNNPIKYADPSGYCAEKSNPYRDSLSELDAKGYDQFLDRTKGIFASETDAQKAFQKLLDRDFNSFAKCFDFSSPKDGAVFWSKNIGAAERYAEMIGGTIMENTQGGKVLNGWTWLGEKFTTWDKGLDTDQQPLWKSVSSAYANGVTGKVAYVHPDLPDGKGIGDVWKNTEAPIVSLRQEEGLVTEVEEVFCNVPKPSI
ncbi:RHS repeat-associated core domain-containing protein [Pseudobacteroides cellulosolvens]|uniref:RHS repeat-associated core domain containing protein-containing protein n=1 Tax=Pseudobacteroides cellulosolvens ATCC 35603 = DSM 2933 TaxID=398512 RepID=A0A0L6JY96_9FIRM|nr:RHS repeat-associated core domain-containing protein [Pseudobacteroides cellulosolvens]KNY30515.1 hypothetical protein Bccel_5795 [Pseudobacteroides cellulosolvens ATCC 35603 = DSM 2933]KNY30522.1 hypothetical protein Bccel_5802 [Pseudobacteroides cellulosolvens ATCC 35603 = DSM 2933]